VIARTSPTLTVNTRLELLIPHGEGEISFPTVVENRRDGMVCLAMPDDSRAKKLLGTVESVRVRVCRRQGVYIARCAMVKVFQDIRLWIEEPEEFERESVRAWVRWPCSLPVHWRGPLPEPEESDSASPSSEGEALTIDISAGGMAIRAEEPLRQGGLYRFVVSLPGDTQAMKGEVLRADDQTVDDEVSYRMAVRFLDATEDQEDAITGYIFRQQQWARRAGLV